MANSNDIPDGYKATELGVLPKEWNVVKIIDVVDFTKKPRSISIASDQILPFIPMDLIPDNNDLVTHWHEKKYSEISSGTFVFKGDLIVAKITPCFENGKQAILDNLPTDFAYTTTEVWPMHPKDNRIFIDFLANYLRAHPVRKELTSKMEGSTNRQRLPRESLQNLSIPLPPLPEQHAIATTLRTVQEAKENTDAVIAATKALKAAMMKHLFTYGPVPPEEAERVALKETEIGQVPEEWDVVKLGEVSEFLQYGTSKKCDYDVKGYPVLRIPNIVNGIIDSTDLKFLDTTIDDFNKIQLKIGDILFVRTNGVRNLVGRCAIYRGEPENSLFASYLIRVRLKSDRALPAFVQYYAETPSGREFLSGQASGSADGKFNINTQTIKSVVLPLPDVVIQKKIVDIILSIDQKLAAEQSRKEALDTLFTSLLHDLMTAKIRVSTA